MIILALDEVYEIQHRKSGLFDKSFDKKRRVVYSRQGVELKKGVKVTQIPLTELNEQAPAIIKNHFSYLNGEYSRTSWEYTSKRTVDRLNEKWATSKSSSHKTRKRSWMRLAIWTDDELTTEQKNIYFRYMQNKSEQSLKGEQIKAILEEEGVRYQLVEDKQRILNFYNDREQGLLKQLMKDAETRYNSKKQDLDYVKKPVILLLGGSGAGKSSLVNAVFGKQLAEIGNGLPVTQDYSVFKDDDMDVTIYDSKGIEHGSIKNGFLKDTEKFFSHVRTKEPITEQVHVVWYVIDLTQARFQPFEVNFCENHLKNVPILFLFNKADSVSEEVSDIMVDTVNSFQFQNNFGCFKTVASRTNFNIKECPKCQSPKIRKRLKEGMCTILCKACKEKTEISKTVGIDELREATVEKLEDLKRYSSVHAQLVELLGKQSKTRIIINEFRKKVGARTGSTKVEEMVRKLCNHYNVDKYVSDMLVDMAVDKYKIYSPKYSFIVRLFYATDYQIVYTLIALEVARFCFNYKMAVAEKAMDTGFFPEAQFISKASLNVDAVQISHVTKHIQAVDYSFGNFLSSTIIDGQAAYAYVPPEPEVDDTEMIHDLRDEESMNKVQQVVEGKLDIDDYRKSIAKKGDDKKESTPKDTTSKNEDQKESQQESKNVEQEKPIQQEASNKEESKVESKEESKEETKEESKEESKEETKDEAKEESSVESKEDKETESKEEPKEETKQETKDEAKEESKEETKETEDNEETTKEEEPKQTEEPGDQEETEESKTTTEAPNKEDDSKDNE